MTKKNQQLQSENVEIFLQGRIIKKILLGRSLRHENNGCLLQYYLKLS